MSQLNELAHRGENSIRREFNPIEKEGKNNRVASPVNIVNSRYLDFDYLE